MSTQSLSTPTKSGTSRFSKALPGVPSLSKSMPDIPIKAKELPPPPPPPHIELAGIETFNTPEIAITSPPLPPLKSSSRPTTPAKQATQMMIPRKAISKMKPPASPQQPEPSPTVSVSSILSAYGRSFDSPLKSADDASQATSWSMTSSVTSPADTEDPYDRKLPALPPKDSPQSTISRSELPGSDIPTVTSPTRSELWRRRPQNSVSGREISELQLKSSNGATAPANGPSELMGSKPSSEARKPIAKKPPGLGGLPGRNIRPGAAKEQAPEPSERNVGTTPASQRPITSEQSTSGPGSNRPPTPEYRKGDGRAPSLTTFAQPVSPPKSPTKTAVDASSKQLPPEPPKEDFKLTTELPRRKPLGSPETGSSASTEKPQIIPQSTSSTTNGSIVTARTSQSETSPGSQRNSNDAAKFPSREGSLQAQPLRRPMEQMRRPPSDDSRIVMSDTQGPMYKGRDGTLYPEMKVTRQPDTRALYFPTWKTQTLDKDAIIASVGLKPSHYNCFHKHKIMNRRTNRNHPLRCQTCDIADSQDRWACTFCHLRICESCLQTFNSNQRDLTQLVKQVSPPTRVSL